MLRGAITITGYWGTETWSYNAEPVALIKTPIDGPFRGTYEGTARLQGSGLSMFIRIVADVHSTGTIMSDGHDAYFDITYPEGMMGIPENVRHVYFDGGDAEEPVAFETVDEGSHSGYHADPATGEYWIIRSDADWTAFWSVHKS